VATTNDLIRRAYQLVNIVGRTESPSGEQYDDGLAALNEMLDQWRDRFDIDLGLYALTAGDTIPGEFMRMLRYNLAVELAMESGLNVEPVILVEAADQREAYRDPDVPNLEIDTALITRRFVNINNGR